MHLIWQARQNESFGLALQEDTPASIQHSLLTHTAQQIKLDLEENHTQVLPHFKVNAKDRKYQFCERNSLGVDLYSHKVFMQKLEYMHKNCGL